MRGLVSCETKGRKSGEPSKLMCIPVLRSESSRALIPVGDGLSTILASNTPRLKVFGRGWNAVQVLWTVGSLGSFALQRQPVSEVTRPYLLRERKARTYIGGGD